MQPCFTPMVQSKYSVKPSFPFTHDLSLEYIDFTTLNTFTLMRIKYKLCICMLNTIESFREINKYTSFRFAL